MIIWNMKNQKLRPFNRQLENISKVDLLLKNFTKIL